MNFNEKIKSHLTTYKTANFPGVPDGQWKKNKKPYSHILPEGIKFDNLLPTYRSDLINYLTSEKVKLHEDFHHLNSSQAMCFNFFYPLYQDRKLELLTDFLGLINEIIKYDTVCFEKLGLETKFGRRATNFDFYFETETGKKIHFEIKYTESEFAKAENNSAKFEEVYSNFLRPINSSYHSSTKFFGNYQILRNLIHIDENSFVTFVFPTENLGIKRGAESVKTDLLQNAFHQHFFSATWERLFDHIFKSTTDAKLAKQLTDFQEKYII